MATLFSYFERRNDSNETPLPDPEGPLSLKVPASTIISANKEVETVLKLSTGESRKRTRGSYDRFSPEEKAIFARAAIDNGVTKTACSTGKNRESFIREYKIRVKSRNFTPAKYMAYTVFRVYGQLAIRNP